jgi:outer membrane immunogenic protein
MKHLYMKHLSIALYAAAVAASVLVTPAAPVMAADMALKAPPPYTPVYSWTGLWIGAYLGGAINTEGQRILLDGVPLADIGAAPKGFLGGVNAGFNFQVSPVFVLGLYVEQDFADLSASGSSAIGPFSVTNATNYLGAAGGRAGYLIDPSSLLYVKGGFAWVGAKPDFAAIGTAKEISDTSFGWQIGGGLEHRLGQNWSVKIEYDHTQAGDRQIDIPVNAVSTLSSLNRFHIDKAVIGISYLFQ